MSNSTRSDFTPKEIKQLPIELANQIAAGEVVERPASIVKELLENSLDAGATSISIEIEKGGCQLIRIRDNGVGIAKEQLKLALTRHATSKIYALDDLEHIMTLGFRGEALASICSISRLLLTSKTAAQNEAWQAYTEGLEMDVIIKPTSHPVGTTIEVRDIFYNTPARRRFLRSEKTEFTHIDDVIRRIALNYHHVSFTVSHNGNIQKRYLADNSKNDTQKRLQQILGANFVAQFKALFWQHDNIKLTGWISQTSSSYEPKNYFYVNGRFVKDRLARHAIQQAKCDFLPETVALHYVIHLELPPEQVDVNVHPTKHEVRFHESRFIHDAIYNAITEQLVTPENTENRPESTFQKPEKITSSTPYFAPKQHEPVSSGIMSQFYAPLKENPPIHAKESQAHYASESKNDADPMRFFPETHQFKNEMNALFSHAFTQSLGRVLMIYDAHFALLEQKQKLVMLSLSKAQQIIYQHQLSEAHLIEKETLLVPLSFTVSKEEMTDFQLLEAPLAQLNLLMSCHKNKVIISEAPLLLRHANLQALLSTLITTLKKTHLPFELHAIIAFLARYLTDQQKEWSLGEAIQLISQIEQMLPDVVLFPPADLLQFIDLSITLKSFDEQK